MEHLVCGWRLALRHPSFTPYNPWFEIAEPSTGASVRSSGRGRCTQKTQSRRDCGLRYCNRNHATIHIVNNITPTSCARPCVTMSSTIPYHTIPSLCSSTICMYVLSTAHRCHRAQCCFGLTCRSSRLRVLRSAWKGRAATVTTRNGNKKTFSHACSSTCA